MGKLADAAKKWGSAMKAVRNAGTIHDRARAERAVRAAFDEILGAYMEVPPAKWDDADKTADAIFEGVP